MRHRPTYTSTQWWPPSNTGANGWGGPWKSALSPSCKRNGTGREERAGRLEEHKAGGKPSVLSTLSQHSPNLTSSARTDRSSRLSVRRQSSESRSGRPRSVTERQQGPAGRTAAWELSISSGRAGSVTRPRAQPGGLDVLRNQRRKGPLKRAAGEVQ